MMFNEILRNLRKENNLELKKVANDLSIPYNNLARYERGESEPNITILISLANYYHVTLDYLIRGNINGIYIVEEEYQKLKSAKESFDMITGCLNDIVHRQDLLMNKGN